MVRYEELSPEDRDALNRQLGRVTPDRPKWSNARKTTTAGVKFSSKLEGRVWLRLRADLKPGDRLYRQVPLALITIAALDDGRPRILTVDFLVVRVDGRREAFDAKGRVSPDWPLRKAAAAAAWDIQITEVTA